jgi:branched-chain amino acid transport system ATP-binding protein/branched-chain amino acid transport system permease protein
VSSYLAQIAIFVSIYLLLAASLNLVMGFGGIFSIMQAAFYGTGAYAAALLVMHLHAPFPLELLAAFLVSAGLAAIVAVLVLRLSSELVIVGTLALQLILSAVFTNWTAVTGGSYGIFGILRPSVLGTPVTSVPSYAALSWIIAAIGFAVALWVGRSAFGLVLRAQREDAILAASFGHDPVREKRVVFVLAGGMAGVAGGLYARYVGYIDPSSFDITQSLSIITITVIGGLGNLWGTLGAAVVLTLAPQLIALVPAVSDVVAQLQLLLYGLILVVIVRFWPHGLIPEQPAVRASRLMPGAKRSELAAPAASGTLDHLASLSIPPLDRKALTISVTDASKHFGGIRAVDGVSLTIEPGRVTALIGPNGAGKTTLFNLLCGLLPSDSGRIAFGSHETTRQRPFEIARLGVTRTFQDVRIFPRLTALENVLFSLPDADAERALARLSTVGLAQQADQLAGSLSYAQQKLLMIAVILAREDPVVFLDEIAAGLDQHSVHAFAGFIRRLAASGRLVCLVEHNLSFVWEAADLVFVMDQGRIIASGPPAEIQTNPQVAEIYFGGHAVTAGA